MPEFIKMTKNLFRAISVLSAHCWILVFDKASPDTVSMVQQTELPPLTMGTSYGQMEIGDASRGNFPQFLSRV